MAALLSAALLAAYAVLSFSLAEAVSGAHGKGADAVAGHDDIGSHEPSGHEAPASHCHAGTDCFLAEMLLPDRAAVIFEAAATAGTAPAGIRFRSITMAPHPPPPRAGQIREGRSIQT